MDISANRKRKRRIVWRSMIAIVCTGVLWLGYLLWRIGSVPDDSGAKADVGIVLGAALWNDKPSPALQERLDRAVELYRSGRIPNMIVSGGAGNGEASLTEAEGMRNYLAEHGIPPVAIMLEKQSTDTYENLLYSKSIMQERGWRSALIITHRYHAARALDMAEFLGYERPLPSPVDSRVLMMSYHKSREAVGWTKWTLDKLLIKTGFK